MDVSVGAKANVDQEDYWNAAAGETWVAFQDQLDRQIGPLGARAIDALNPKLGERFVDLGCGCGQTTLQLAERVGPDGRVLGLDLSHPMLTVARRRAADAGLQAVAFVRADAQTQAFDPASLDGAYSRFGVMFFADPVAAFTNIRRGLRPEGRLAFVCWRSMAENEWMSVPLRAGLQHLQPAPPQDPLAPGPFAFADPERVRGVLADAGFQQIVIEGHDQRIGAGNLDETVTMALRVGPLGALLRGQPEAREAVTRTLQDALQPYVTPEGVSMKSATWIVRATAS